MSIDEDRIAAHARAVPLSFQTLSFSSLSHLADPLILLLLLLSPLSLCLSRWPSSPIPQSPPSPLSLYIKKSPPIEPPPITPPIPYPLISFSIYGHRPFVSSLPQLLPISPPPIPSTLFSYFKNPLPSPLLSSLLPFRVAGPPPPHFLNPHPRRPSSSLPQPLPIVGLPSTHFPNPHPYRSFSSLPQPPPSPALPLYSLTPTHRSHPYQPSSSLPQHLLAHVLLSSPNPTHQ